MVLVAGAAAGVAASPFLGVQGDWARPVAAVLLLVALFVRGGRAGTLSLAVIGITGALAGLMVGGARLDRIDRNALDGPSGPAVLAGFATESPSSSRGTARFGFDSQEGRVLVEARSADVSGIRAGLGLEIRGRLDPAADWQRGDLERRGIRMILRAGRIATTGGRREGLTGIVDRMRDRALTALGASVPDREGALSRGFVLGDVSGIDARTTEDFRRSGLSHLLAVSGQNIVLLALLASPFLSLAGLGPRTRLLALGVLIIGYVPLAGGGPSIQRAGVMGLAGLIAVAATRAPSRAYGLLAAALVTLGLDPRASADIGWQLSFAAVLGIMLFARPFVVRTSALIGTGGWRSPLAEGISVTLAATIATAPLTALHFERLPVATVLANLAAMPAVAPAMWMGMVSIAAGQVSPVLAVPFNLIGSVCLAWIAQVAAWLGRPGWAVLEVGVGPLPLAGASALGGLFLWLLLRFWRPGVHERRSRFPIVVAVVAVLVALILLLPGADRRRLEPPPPGGARVEVLDVGQGDAILIRPWGVDPLLIDGGPPGGDLQGALESAGVDRLGAVIVTHPDLDHYAGLLDVVGLLPVDRLLFDHAPGELVGLARESGTRLGRIASGDVITAGNTRLEILWPPPKVPGSHEAAGEDTNGRSVVALFSWRRFRMLLTGDAEAESVPLTPGPIDVLKVSHHGSEDDGLAGLLDRSAPGLAVISAGEGNPHGHPHPSVLRELDASRVAVRRTDISGTVSIVLGGEGRGYEVESGE